MAVREHHNVTGAKIDPRAIFELDPGAALCHEMVDDDVRGFRAQMRRD